MTRDEFISEGTKFYLNYGFDLASARKHVLDVMSGCEGEDGWEQELVDCIESGDVETFFIEFDIQYWED